MRPEEARRTFVHGRILRNMVGDKGKQRPPEADAGTLRVEERLVDLELRFMKLERFALDLSNTVAQQQRTIDALVAETKRLRERSADEEPEANDDRPPHY
jgi:uncharacterized coiled-coil protein SlyX